MSNYLLGSSYYPEWWKEEEWKKDFHKMAELGLNAVRMGEFAWSWYEKKEGEYNFEPMKKAVEIAASEGISTIMCTTTAVCPPWLYKKYPEVKGGNEMGIYNFGGRKGNCLSSDIFLEYAYKITEEQAKAFAKDKNVVGWQLDNEPGFPFVCYDPVTEKKFRIWLKNKYKTIDKLNEAWFSMMWSNVYTDFEEICLPVNAPEGGWNPGIKLDYRRFFSDNFNNLLSNEARIIREQGSNQFIYTNWPGANWSVSCEEAMEYLDYSAWDNYVPVPVNDDYRVQTRSSMEHDLCRRLSNGKQKLLIAEQIACPHANTKPEAVRMQTWLDVAHGAFGNIFFEFRVPLGGIEQAYPSILNPDGTFNRCENVIKNLSKNINKVYPLIDGAETVSPIASVYSYQNSWCYYNWIVDGDYDEDFFEAHGGFKNALMQNLDVAFPSDDFSKYKIVVAPNLRILSEAEQRNFEEYVKNGGVLVINPVAGTKTAENLLKETRQPALFNGQSGVHVVSSIHSGDMNKQQAPYGEKASVVFENGEEFEVFAEMYELEADSDAEIFATYNCGRLKGKPAGTVKKIGKGYVIVYASNARDYKFYEALARVANKYAHVEPIINVPDGVLVSSRKNGNDTYVIAVNAKTSDVEITLDKPLFDVLNEKEISGKIKLEGFDVLFAKEI